MKRLILLLALVALIVAFFALDLGRFLTLDALKAGQATFAVWYEASPWLVAGAYLLIYVAVTALSLPGAAVMTLAGGALFGLWVGTLVVSFASSIGATLAFLASRFLFHDWVQGRYGERLAAINKGVQKDGAFYLFTLRLVPVFPFFVINLLMGLTPIKARTFYWVSQVGMLAGTIVCVNAGTQLGGIDSLAGILSPALLASFALLGVFPLLAKRLVALARARKVYAGWRRPKRFDRNLVVIGAGSGGLVTAYIGAAVKAKVTLVEKHRMGGDCLNTGCVPSKALIRPANLARHRGALSHLEERMKKSLFRAPRFILVLSLFWTALAQAQSFDHSAWDGLLKRHVQPIRGGVATQVDYAGMARERALLEGYLDALGGVSESDFRRWPKKKRLAFLINAYNAWTVELVLTAWPKLDSIKDLGSLLGSPWKKRFIPLLGKTRSLDDIEHGMIRAKGVYDEPRIHFAVNCASIGCPALRSEAYTAARLDTQLADATRRFLSDRTRNRLADGRLEVSSIFKWYGEDFERAGGLRAFLAGQGEVLGLTDAERQGLREGSIEIDFLDYDWRLNVKR